MIGKWIKMLEIHAKYFRHVFGSKWTNGRSERLAWRASEQASYI
jgi:hypothetical protein